MMRLLIATDHSFLRHQSGVFDTYCFDRAFFDDYLQVFDAVEVVSRIAHVEVLPRGAFRSDGEGVGFVGMTDVHGPAWLLRASRLNRRVLDSALQRADALVVRVPGELGWLAAVEARRVGKPYMIEVIGDPKEALLSSGTGLHYRLIAWLGAKHLRQLARYADAGSYVSHHLARKYPVHDGRSYDIVSSIRLDVGSITPPRIFPERIERLSVAHVGRLIPRKRCRDIIEAARAVLNTGVNLSVHLAGDGPERLELEAMCRKWGMKEQVIFHGHIADRKALNDLLDRSDLLLMASASEGLPRAIVEAMARGLPVIAAKTAGVDELVQESELFSVGDVRRLAELIVTLAGQPRRLTEISGHGTETARHYSADLLSPKRQGLYKALRSKAGERLSARGE